jgi:hypothetical protein
MHRSLVHHVSIAFFVFSFGLYHGLTTLVLDTPRPDAHSRFLDLLEQFRQSFSEKLRIKGDLATEQKETVDKLLRETEHEMASSLQLESPGGHFPRQQQPFEFVFEAGSDSVFQGDSISSESSTTTHTDVWNSLSSGHSGSAQNTAPEAKLQDPTDVPYFIDPRLLDKRTDDFDLPTLSNQ